MTGGSRPKVYPTKQDPTPSPAVVEEMTAAKDATKRKTQKQGRGANILAGRLMQRSILNFGKSKVGE